MRNYILMLMQSTHLSLRLCALMAIASAHALTAAEAEVIYNNTSTPMLDASFTPPRIRYADSKTEYGDQLHLAGTARMVTDIYIEYYGNFTGQGDEFGRLRIYNNRNVYD